MSCHDMARLEQGVAAWLPMREWQFLDLAHWQVRGARQRQNHVDGGNALHDSLRPHAFTD